ncbi:Muscle, skeletal receptor tyrosine-protein kinase, partial [Stegodyphus mimosarum]
MGAYLCIASNGVPPSVSKRILLQVNFQPKIRVANQMVRASVGTETVLGCHLEASPRPLTSWIRHDDAILINNNKYEMHEIENSYKILMQLKIKNVTENDFGHYKCVAKNTFGDKEGFIRLIEIPPTTSTTMSTLPYNVFIPQRVVTESHTVSDVTTPEKKEYGAPTTNSLRDESHIVSSEKQLRPGKIESRLEDEKQQKRTTDHRTLHPKKPTSEAGKERVSSCITVAAVLVANFLLKKTF